MRKILFMAAALTLGTSAHAWQPETEAGTDKPAMTKLAVNSVKATSEAESKTGLAAYKSAKTAAVVDTAGYPVDKSMAVGGPDEASVDVWPACRPGPGDDRCIQLYEPGVLTALAALKSEANVAMGGPFEPAEATAYSGIGGPVEARTGYPACSATVTDSCIQLHERGVTGAGN